MRGIERQKERKRRLVAVALDLWDGERSLVHKEVGSY
jgi:hypothetical protein